MSLIAQKQILRTQMKTLRAEKASTFPAASEKASEIFLAHFSYYTRFALYYPLPDEMDTRPLMTSLTAQGKIIGLPQVDDKGLVFRRWQSGETLTRGPYQTLEPELQAEIMNPEVVVVPLLAFDSKGYRLGYGKGHYDRTLAALRQNGGVIAVGYAWSFQAVETLPHEAHDMPLDTVVCENSIIEFSR